MNLWLWRFRFFAYRDTHWDTPHLSFAWWGGYRASYTLWDLSLVVLCVRMGIGWKTAAQATP